MVRRKPRRPAAANGRKVAKALRDAIEIADDALAKLTVRPVKPRRAKRKR